MIGSKHSLLQTNKPVVIVAEIGVNHEGSLLKAKQLIDIAVENGADAVKFQSYTPELYISRNDKERLDRVRRFALSDEDFVDLAQYAKSCGVTFFSTAVTSDKISFLQEISPIIKIASGDVTELSLVESVARSGADIVMSTGCSSIEEIEKAVEVIAGVVSGESLYDRLILLHCVSSYPVPFSQAQLDAIPELARYFSPIVLGYSNHVPSTLAVSCAVALGARVVEVHITDNKQGRDFRDHALSMDGEDLRYLSETLPLVASMCHRTGDSTAPREIMACELEQLRSLRKGLIVSRDIASSTVLKREDIALARPLGDFSSGDIDKIIGRKTVKSLLKGEQISREDIEL